MYLKMDLKVDYRELKLIYNNKYLFKIMIKMLKNKCKTSKI